MMSSHIEEGLQGDSVEGAGIVGFRLPHVGFLGSGTTHVSAITSQFDTISPLFVRQSSFRLLVQVPIKNSIVKVLY